MQLNQRLNKMATVETDIAVLKQENVSNKELLTRLAATTDRIGEVSSYMSKILAVHDERIAASENKATAAAAQIEQRRLDLVDDLKVVSTRLTEVHTALSNEIAHTETRITAKLDEMRTEASSDKKAHDVRLTSLENWRWMLVGGGIVLGFVIGRIPYMTSILNGLSQ
jgi:hypothetical protein